MLLKGSTDILERKQELRKIHIKLTFATAFLFGSVHTIIIISELYTLVTDPYVFPWGNTKENPWFYHYPTVFVSILLLCLLSHGAGLGLMMAGQLKKKPYLRILGAVIIGVVAVLSLGTMLLEMQRIPGY